MTLIEVVRFLKHHEQKLFLAGMAFYDINWNKPHDTLRHYDIRVADT